MCPAVGQGLGLGCASSVSDTLFSGACLLISLQTPKPGASGEGPSGPASPWSVSLEMAFNRTFCNDGNVFCLLSPIC